MSPDRAVTLQQLVGPFTDSCLSLLQVLSIHLDCDRDSIIYVCDPVGPACHTVS